MFIGGLPHEWHEDHVKNLLLQFGRLKSFHLGTFVRSEPCSQGQGRPVFEGLRFLRVRRRHRSRECDSQPQRCAIWSSHYYRKAKLGRISNCRDPCKPKRCAASRRSASRTNAESASNEPPDRSCCCECRHPFNGGRSHNADQSRFAERWQPRSSSCGRHGSRISCYK